MKVESNKTPDLQSSKENILPAFPSPQPSATKSTLSQHPQAEKQQDNAWFSTCLLNTGCAISSCFLAFVALFFKFFSCLFAPFSICFKWIKK